MSHNIFEVHKVENININIVINKPTMKRLPLKVIQDDIDEQSYLASSIHKKTAINSPTPSLQCNEKISSIHKAMLMQSSNANSLGQYEYKCHYETYEADIKASMVSVKCILAHHHIASILRTRMVDWMVEVFSIFGCCTESLFGAVQLMDRYFQLTSKKLVEEDIHLLGITTILISSKLHDVRPIEVCDAVEKISRDKYSAEVIKAMEKEVCETLKWDLWVPTTLELLRTMACNLEYSFLTSNQEDNLKLRLITESILCVAEKYAIVSLYDAAVIQEYSCEKIAQTSMMRAMKKVNKVMLQHSAAVGKLLKWFNAKHCYDRKCSSEIHRVEKRLVELSLINYQKCSFEE
jgi:Cyclin, N-terminal domain